MGTAFRDHNWWHFKTAVPLLMSICSKTGLLRSLLQLAGLFEKAAADLNRGLETGGFHTQQG